MFGKSLDASKLKKAINNALARIAILKKQHHVRWSQARSDVVQLLNLGHQESAILRVDHVIREQNLLDALAIIEGYCCLLLERIQLIRNAIQCPEELKEAVASLIFAASRYGQLPELQKISVTFTKKYGKGFTNHAVELRNNCGVNAKIAKRLPNRRTSLGTRLKVLNEIAAEHGIILEQQRENLEINEEKMNAGKTTRPESQEQDNERKSPADEIPKAINSYRDVKQAAKAAFELASQAAAAAKAAVQLSHTKLHADDDGNNLNDSRNHQPRKVADDRNEKDATPLEDAFEENFSKFNIKMSRKNLRSRNEEAGQSNTKAEERGVASFFTSESDGDADDHKKIAIKIPTEEGFSSFMNNFLQEKNSVADKNDRKGSSHVSADQDSSSRRYYGDGTTTDGSSRGRRPISIRTRRNGATPRRSRRQVYVRP